MNTFPSTPNAKTEQGHNSRCRYAPKDTARTEQEHSSFLKTIKIIFFKLTFLTVNLQLFPLK